MADIDLIIKIDEDEYKARQHWVANPRALISPVDKAIANGTIIEENNNDLANDYWKSAGYQIGLNDAWEAAKKIVLPLNEGGIPLFSNIFTKLTDGIYDLTDVFKNYSASEVIDKIKEYEKKNKKEDFVMGDEVKDNLDTVSIVICKSEEEGEVYIVNNTYTPPIQRIPTKFLKKTGKHYDELKDILSKLGGNSMEDVNKKIVNKIKEKLSHEAT